MILGRITEVNGIKVVGTFYEKLPPHIIRGGIHLPAPQINSYVKTNVGLDVIICQIVGEHEFESNNQARQPESESFQVDLEVRGRISNGQFKGGLRCLPIVGAKIELMEKEDYAVLYGTKGGLCIGVNLFDVNTEVYLDPNKLIPSHIGIFGNTGSGKSNTLSKILKEYLNIIINKKTTNGRVILFDLNNEYGGSSIIDSSMKRIYQLSTRKQSENIDYSNKIPLCLDSFTEDTWGVLLRATQKTQMPIIRSAYRKWKNPKPNEAIEQIKWILVNKRKQVFFTLRHYLQGYFTIIDKIDFNSKYNSFYYYVDNKIKYIDTYEDCPPIEMKGPCDEFIRFIICLHIEIAKSNESGTNYDYIQPLIPRAANLETDFNKIFNISSKGNIEDIFDDKPFTIIQLGNVNSNMREVIPSLLSDLLLKKAADDRGDSKPSKITSIVVDEAHNILSYNPNNSEDVIHGNTLQVFEKIIKEGRKYGLFLYLSSQRPSDISETITSQIHNYFIHRLVNPRDIEKIRKTVSFMGDGSLSMLSSLGQGECIISGPSLYMPQYVYVTELCDSEKPNSADIVLFGKDGIFE